MPVDRTSKCLNARGRQAEPVLADEKSADKNAAPPVRVETCDVAEQHQDCIWISRVGCAPVAFFRGVTTKAEPGQGERGVTGGVRVALDTHRNATRRRHSAVAGMF